MTKLVFIVYLQKGLNHLFVRVAERLCACGSVCLRCVSAAASEGVRANVVLNVNFFGLRFSHSACRLKCLFGCNLAQ